MQDLICNPHTKQCFVAPLSPAGPVVDVGKHTGKLVYALIHESKARVKGKFVRKLIVHGYMFSPLRTRFNTLVSLIAKDES